MIRKSQFIQHFFCDMSKTYEIVKMIGEGNYGQVYQVKNKETGEYHACKMIEKSKIKRPDRFRLEIELLKSVDHQNIVKLYKIFEDETHIFLIQEECRGGELFQIVKDKVSKKDYYKETEVAGLFKQIISAIVYCHNKGVCHRDLKLENLLFFSTNENLIKLIDFGLSKYYTKSDKMDSIVGTVCYMAPEVFLGDYTEKCDVWSAGVILYILLSGSPPFWGKNPTEIKNKIKNLDYNFGSSHWNYISPQAKDLLNKIFVDFEIRLSSRDVLNHEWLCKMAPNSKERILELELDKMIEYSFLNKLQKAIVAFICYRFNINQISSLNEIFESLDINSDGEISISELREAINFLSENNMISLEEEEIEFIFKEIDLDRNGGINFNEFVSSMIDYKNQIKRDHVIEAFNSFDTDKDGKISLMELEEIIKPMNDEDCEIIKQLVQEIDLKKDGEIDIQEFLNCMGIGD